MTAKEVREKYINFFKAEPRNHIEIPPAPLVLDADPTTLFTSSGMQPLVPYLMGQDHPSGSRRLVDSQPSLRLQDIDEVGDNCHTTFFEMLGNWSLGDYFKKDQLPWIFEFLTKELDLPQQRLWVSVFEGSAQVPKDVDSADIWKKVGIPENKIVYYGVNNNWWSKSGTPDEMPIGEIGGPDSEIFYDFDPENKLKIHENSPHKNEECNLTCQCGRFLEIGNSVFIQYKKVEEDKLEELPTKC
jgi:alanyl-tRNA synthetase